MSEEIGNPSVVSDTRTQFSQGGAARSKAVAAFQNQIENVPEEGAEPLPTTKEKFVKGCSYVGRSPWIMGLITTVIVMVLLLVIRPSIVMKKTKNRLEKPSVNFVAVLVWSLTAGLIVTAFPYIWNFALKKMNK